jgi:hypothetical protein
VSTSSSPVNLHPVGLASCGSVLWRYRGRLQLTAIVKGTFSLSPTGAMALVAQEPLVPHDTHYDGDARRSLRAAGDLVPYRAKADVVLTGWVYVSPEDPAQGVTVRLSVVRDKPLLDKKIQVVGDRLPRSLVASPFTQMPLGYERAFGGPGWSDNPIGTGFAPGSPPPNLIDPFNPQRTVGFGPIPEAWPARASLLGALHPAALQQPLPELPDQFDWAYFQAAPADQRVDFLRGSERILIENVYSSHRSIQLRLPAAKGIGKLHGLKGFDKGRPITLNADSLHIDTELGRCSLSWRGSVPLPEDVDLSRLHVVAGIELEGQPLSMPAPEIAAGGAASALDGASTLALSGAPAGDTVELTSAVARGGALPFTPAAKPAEAVSTSLEKLSAAAAAQVRIREGLSRKPFEGTLDISAVAPGAPALPFVPSFDEPATASPPREDPGSSRPAPPVDMAATITAVGPAPAPVEPFAIARPGESGPGAVIPGAPWSGVAAAHLPAAALGAATLTLDTDAPSAPAPPPVAAPDLPSMAMPETASMAMPGPAPDPLAAEILDEDSTIVRTAPDTPPPTPATPPPAPADAAPPAVATVEKPAWSWAPQEPAIEKPAAAAPPPAPKPDRTAGLYKRFSKKDNPSR